MKSKVFSTLLSMLLGFTLMAQTRITGVVSDNAGPLVGVSVIEQNTTNGTVTDENGRFVLTVQLGATILFTSIGYKDQTVEVGSRTNFSIFLEEDSELLEETVVIGYGIQKKSDVTGSVASVDAESMALRSPISVVQGLQGAAAGVVITQSSGDPSGGYNIRIRGVGTVQGNTNPLWVVDGIQYGTTSNLSWLDPQDVEKIEILKDASATAIYGARGANGVILVSTKKGQVGKVRVDLRSDFGVSTFASRLDMASLDEWLPAYRESIKNDGRLPFPAFDGSYDSKLNEIDWQDVMTQTAYRQQYHLSVSGGSESVRSNFSIGYLDNRGIIVSSWSKRLNMRLNTDFNITKWLKSGFSIGFNTGKNKGGGNMINYARIVPTMDYVDQNTGKLMTVPVVYPDGSFGHFTFQNDVDYTGGRYQTNPYADQHQQEFGKDWDNDNGSVRNAFWAEVTLFKGLTFRTNLNYDFSGNNGWSYRQPYIDNQYHYAQYAGDDPVDNFSTSGGASTSVGAENYLTYDNLFGKHHVTVLLGQSASKYHGSSNGSSTQDLTFGFLRGFFSTDSVAYNDGSGGPDISTRFASYFARVNYSFDSRYMLTASIRRDGSSNFGKSNRWGTFPSFSLAWNLGNEGFLKDLHVFDVLKLRVGWGATGNANVSPTASVPQLSAGGTSFSFFDDGGDATRIIGIAQTSEIDTGLHWESSVQTNIGLDMAFFNNSLTFSVDWYNRQSRDLILRKTIRPSAGFNNITTNFGSIRNRGLEFALGYKKQINRDWFVAASATGSTNWNKAIDIGSGTTVSGADGSGWDDRQVSFNGLPLGTYQGYKVLHIIKDQSEIDVLNEAAVAKYGQGSYYDRQSTGPGDFLFADINGDGHITPEDKFFMGNGFPDLVYGFNIAVNFRNWDATAYMYGELGKQVLSWSKCYLTTLRNETNGYFNLLSEAAEDYYSSSNPDAVFPRISRTDESMNTRVSDFYVENGSYLKISNFQIGYTLNKELFGGIFRNVRLYGQIQNLLTISPYTKYGDPEISGGVTTTGYDGGRYPFPRTFMFGFQLGL